ncbi:MAG TPA: MFS transporter, partial [Methylomirabilota bacterium]|nr:MFS transporter [Methylomirabilota bacterium]
MTPAPPSTERSTRATPPTQRNPWAWVPTLYLAEGLPYVVVMTVSVIMYKGMGISNSDIALYTSWLYLPWVIKPLWSPVVDILKTRRLWIWVMQLIVGAGLAGVALTLRGPNFFGYSLAFLVLLAFSSATHDIAADGFYMLATTEREQAFFVGIRSTFYRISMISGQGLLVILAGFIQSHTGLPNVELTISSRPNAALVEAISPGRFESPPGERLEIVAEPVSVAINPEPRSTQEVNRLIAAAKASNATNGFHASQPATLAREDSGWSRYVSQPFKTACAYIGRLISSPFRA